jgi:Molecular chaperone GrpE (heat shock protein)
MTKDKVNNPEIVEEEQEVLEAENLSAEELLKKQIESLELEAADWKTNYYKVFADMENLKRRLQSEHQNSLKYMMQDFVDSLLPVIDNLTRAINVKATNEEIIQFLKGFEMINNQLVEVLNKQGVEAIKTIGEEFDPNFHQAVMTSYDEEIAENIIIEELQKGYTLNERVIRASLVKVNQK